MALLSYLTGSESALAPYMVALIVAFDRKLSALLGGKSFILMWSAAVNPGVQMPANLFGKTFFFTQGLVTYSPYVPGFIAKTFTVNDPVTGVATVVGGARPYDHAPFVAAEGAAVAASYDTTKHIAKCQTFTGAPYYTDGLGQVNGVGLFDHSLQIHTRQFQGPGDPAPRTYWLQEFTTNKKVLTPEKKHRYGLADIIIEGVVVINLPNSYDKYFCFRFHNLQAVNCTVTLGGFVFVLLPFECRTVRRDWDSITRSWANYRTHVEGADEYYPRYFFNYEGKHTLASGAVVKADPRSLWFFAGDVTDAVGSAGGRTTVSNTPAQSCQANNLLNPCLIYDFAQLLTNDTWGPSVTSGWQLNGKGNYAWFNRDPHELCDMAADFAGVFPYLTPGYNNATIGDLIIHNGALKIARKLRTDVNTITVDEVLFRGFKTFSADCLAKSIVVGSNGNGDITLLNNSPTYLQTLISWQTNLLKTKSYGHEVNIPTARVIDTALALDSNLFENDAAAHFTQDAAGISSFTPSLRAGYRITQKVLTDLVGSTVRYADVNGVTVSVVLPTTPRLDETALVQARSAAGYHSIPVGALSDLSFFGNPSLTSQNNLVVNFDPVVLMLTPEGWVVKFTEKVVNGPWLQNAGTPPRNTFGRAYTYNALTDMWEIKHLVRLRKHGFGYGEFGRDNAACFTPQHGRPVCVGITEELSGVDGEDFDFPTQHASETSVKVLRQISALDDCFLLAGKGGRFFTLGSPTPLDGMVQFAQNYQTPGWYKTYQFSLTSTQANGPRSVPPAALTFLPLEIRDYNALAQTVNQLKTGRPLDWRAVRIVYGTVVLDFASYDTDGGLGNWMNHFGPRDAFDHAQITAPAPSDCFGVVVKGNPYWRAWLASVNVSVFDHTGLPATWAQYRFANNLDSSIVCNWAAAISNINSSHTTLSGSTYLTVRADIALDMEVNFGPDIVPDDEFQRGGVFIHAGGHLAYIDCDNGPALDLRPGVGNTGSTGLVQVNRVGAVYLEDYVGVQWVSITQITALFATLSFPFEFSEHFQPLKLEFAELPAVLEDTPLITRRSHQSFAQYTFHNQVRTYPLNFAPVSTEVYEADLISSVGLAGRTGSLNAGNSAIGYKIRRKQILYHHDDSGEWKWPVSATPSRRWVNRTVGKYTYENNGPVSGNANWVPHNSPGFHLGVQISTSFGTDSAGTQYVRPVCSVNMLAVDGSANIPAYQTTPDWFYTTDVDTTVTPSFNTTLRTLRSAGALFIWRRFPTNETAETFAAWMNAERAWTAVRIVSSLGAGHDLWKMPRAGVAREFDWFDQNVNNYFRNKRVNGGIARAPVRLIPAGLASSSIAQDGLTILKPGPDETFLPWLDPTPSLNL